MKLFLVAALAGLALAVPADYATDKARSLCVSYLKPMLSFHTAKVRAMRRPAPHRLSVGGPDLYRQSQQLQPGRRLPRHLRHAAVLRRLRGHRVSGRQAVHRRPAR